MNLLSRAALAVLVGAAGVGCFDVFDTYDRNDGQGAGAAGAGGAGGAPCFEPEPMPTCPTGDYDFTKTLATPFRARQGAMSPVTGRALVVGNYSEATTLDGNSNELPVLVNHANFFLWLVGRETDDGIPTFLNAQSVHSANTSADSSNLPRVLDVIATPDGGFAVLLRAQVGLSVPSAVDATAQDNTTDVADAAVVKLDQDGDITWAVYLEAGNQRIEVDALYATETSVLVGGFTPSYLLNRRVWNLGSWNTEVVSNPVATMNSASLFVWELSIADGADVDLTRWAADGVLSTISGIVEVDGTRTVAGVYTESFPNFGGVDDPPIATAITPFVVALDATHKNATRKSVVGFPARDHTPPSLLPVACGFALFGGTDGVVTSQATWADATLAEGQHGSFIAKLSPELETEWVHVHELAAPATSYPLHSATRSQDSLILGHRLDDDPAADPDIITLDPGGTDPKVATFPQTDVVFSKVSLTGEFEDGLLLGPNEPDSVADLTLSAGPCGDLLVGTFFDTLVVDGETFTSPDQTRSLVMFRKAGLF